MLVPFSNKDAKPARRRASVSRQHSLWGRGCAADPCRKAANKAAAKLEELPFQEIVDIWSQDPGELDMQQVLRREDVCRHAGEALGAAAAEHCKAVRKAGLQHAGDVSLYLALSDFDRLATRQSQGKRLQFLDFGVGALKE